MRLLKNYKFKASSILETVIATTIISICIAIAIVVYVQVIQSASSVAEIQARNAMEEMYRKTVIHHNYRTEHIKTDLYTIQKQTSEVGGSKQLLRIDFSITIGKRTSHFIRYFSSEGSHIETKQF